MRGGRGKAFATTQVPFDVPRERVGLGDEWVIRQWKALWAAACSENVWMAGSRLIRPRSTFGEGWRMIQAEENAGLSCTDDVLYCGVRDSGGSPSDKDKWVARAARPRNWQQWESLNEKELTQASRWIRWW